MEILRISKDAQVLQDPAAVLREQPQGFVYRIPKGTYSEKSIL